MRKSSISFFFFIAILISGTWFYLAYKFEKVAKEEIIPKIENDNSLISFDQSSLKINKAMFNIELGKITLFPDNKLFSLSIDHAKVFYNPFTDKLILHFGGERLSLKIDDINLYVSNPRNQIQFNRSLLNREFNKFDILYSFGETEFFDLETNEKALSFAKGNINCAFNKGDSYYDVKTKIDLEDLSVSPKYYNELDMIASSIILDINRDSLKETGRQVFNDEIVALQEEINKITGPSDYSLSFETSVPLKLADDFLKFINDRSYLSVVATDFLDLDKFKLEFSEHYTKSGIQFNYEINLNKLDSIINGNFDLSSERIPSDQINDKLPNLVAKISSNFISKFDPYSKLSAEDITPLIQKMLSTNYKLVTNFEIDIDKKAFDFEANSNWDDYKIKLTGSKKDSTLLTRLEFEKFGLVLQNLFGLSNDLMTKILEKLQANDQVKTNLKNTLALNQYIKNHGLEVARVFHSGKDLKPEDTLITNVEANIDQFDIKINDKPFTEIVSDERVTKFLNNWQNSNIKE